MRVLIYKRTHVGDPDERGVFGASDCMGQVRGYDYEAVIGVGGISGEPVRHGIDRKITWIGIGPTWGPTFGRGPLVTFEHFLLFDENGPEFGAWAPETAQRIYGGRVRYVIQDVDLSMPGELQEVITWARRNSVRSSAVRQTTYKGFKVRCKTTAATTAAKRKRIC